ncbi:MAG TPA: aldo/keto reductase, partial [Sphaerochaeta sp.]|nr:aldo/keto reductase [Sphaerochaeta sp.]
HNFGSDASYRGCKELVLGSFDRGITHFDLANNYGPPPGSAETMFAKILHEELNAYRDELVVSTKAGYQMWEGPYGEWGSKKHLVSSLDQSLKRLQLEYVDIFYHHRPDIETPLEETVQALAGIVRSGKALYVGISNYGVEATLRIADLLKLEGVPCLIHQMQYSMLSRSNEQLFPVLQEKGIGGIAFSPLAQGLLTGKYLQGVPTDSRVARHSEFLTVASLTSDVLDRVTALQKIAFERDQSLAQMALSWVLREPSLASVILGASKLEQLDDNLQALSNRFFADEQSNRIETILSGVTTDG